MAYINGKKTLTIIKTEGVVTNNASDVLYDNSDSGLKATNVKSAIDELKEETINVREVAEGKTSTYILNCNQAEPTEESFSEGMVNIIGYYKMNGDKINSFEEYQEYVNGYVFTNNLFNSDAESFTNYIYNQETFSVNYGFMIFKVNDGYYIVCKLGELNKGDIVLTTDANICDRWTSDDGTTFYALEARTFEVAGQYVNKMDAPTSTTLTDEQIALFKEGVFIEGDFLNHYNPIFFPASLWNDTTYFGAFIGPVSGGSATTVIRYYSINKTTKEISQSTGKFLSINNVGVLNDKAFPIYPSDTTKNYALKQVAGVLTWVEEPIILTQAEYDALETKDENTIYYIKEE